MCESAVYIIDKNEERLVLESVDSLEVRGDQIQLVNIFGEKKEINAKVRSFYMTGHKIILESL